MQYSSEAPKGPPSIILPVNSTKAEMRTLAVRLYCGSESRSAYVIITGCGDATDLARLSKNRKVVAFCKRVIKSDLIHCLTPNVPPNRNPHRWGAWDVWATVYSEWTADVSSRQIEMLTAWVARLLTGRSW